MVLAATRPPVKSGAAEIPRLTMVNWGMAVVVLGVLDDDGRRCDRLCGRAGSRATWQFWQEMA